MRRRSRSFGVRENWHRPANPSRARPGAPRAPSPLPREELAPAQERLPYERPAAREIHEDPRRGRASRRKQREESQLEDAAMIQKLCEMKQEPHEPAEFGFVLKSGQVKSYILRSDSLVQAIIFPATAIGTDKVRRIAIRASGTNG